MQSQLCSLGDVMCWLGSRNPSWNRRDQSRSRIPPCPSSSRKRSRQANQPQKQTLLDEASRNRFHRDRFAGKGFLGTGLPRTSFHRTVSPETSFPTTVSSGISFARDNLSTLSESMPQTDTNCKQHVQHRGFVFGVLTRSILFCLVDCAFVFARRRFR
jgi:hypothetical protein